MRIAILGAGGVGGYYGGVLARAGYDVVMLARGAHLDVLRARGIEIRTPEGSFTAAVEATDNPQALGQAEYALLAVKNYSLAEIAPTVRAMAESGAVIVPLLNGVEVVERLLRHGIPERRILGGLTAISAEKVAPGIVERKSTLQRVVVGEARGGTSAHTERIVSALCDAGVAAEVTGDITAEVSPSSRSLPRWRRCVAWHAHR